MANLYKCKRKIIFGFDIWDLAVIIFCFLVILFSGCSLYFANQIKELSPEQIKALQELNMKVLVCANITAPPATGGITYLLLPNDATVDVGFSPNCQLLTGKVN